MVLYLDITVSELTITDDDMMISDISMMTVMRMTHRVSETDHYL